MKLLKTSCSSGKKIFFLPEQIPIFCLMNPVDFYFFPLESEDHLEVNLYNGGLLIILRVNICKKNKYIKAFMYDLF